MLIKLNAFRGDDRPGDTIDVPDADGALLIHHGAAFAADGPDAELDKAGTAAARTVRGEAALQATSGADAAEAPQS